MGKGSKWRDTNFKKYFENWDDINKSETPAAVTVTKLKNGKIRYTYTKKEVKND